MKERSFSGRKGATCKSLKVRASGQDASGDLAGERMGGEPGEVSRRQVAPAGELVLQPRAVGRHRGL